ncbi:MAG: DNA-binding protein [Nanoarchaeota archaeon]|nr:DNA-binding protein [Nanoarchaeota archaeon]
MIGKLAPGMTNVNLIGLVVSKGDKRSVNTKYGKSEVCDVVIKDESGEVGLTLWAEQISKVKEGDEVEIQGAYVTEWQGEIKLNIPKRGLLQKASV